MENIPRLRKLMDENEQNEKIEDLEKDFKELHEKLEELREERDSEKVGTPDFEKLVIKDRPFVVHWVEDTEYSTITTEAEAEAVFLAAALARDNTSGKLPVSHGDFMVIGTDCAWLAVCVTVDGMLQKEDPHAPEVAKSEVVTISSQSVVRREFMVWNACSEYSCPECSLPISTLGDSSTWAVSLGTCTKFDDLMSVSAVTGSEGTTLTFKKREFSINSCGEVISISAESDVEILVPCCSPWDGDENWMGCEEYDTMPGTITLKITDGVGTTNYTLYKYTESAFCRYVRDPTGGDSSPHPQYTVRWLLPSSHWKIDLAGGIAYATNPLLIGAYTDATPPAGTTFEVTL